MSVSPVRVATGLKACPKCKYDAIFLPLIPAASYDGKLYGSRSEGFCNNPFCDQLFWYYPATGRVTRRNVGWTLDDYHANRRTQYANLRYINIMRRLGDLPPLMEVPDELWSTTAYKPPLSLIARLRHGAVEWFWWIVAAFKSPFLGKLPSPLESGEKTINQMRAERGLNSVGVYNEE